MAGALLLPPHSAASLCSQGLPCSRRHYSASARGTTRCQVGAKEMQTPNHRLQIQGLLQLPRLSAISTFFPVHPLRPASHSGGTFPHCFLACMHGVLHSSHPLPCIRLSFKLYSRDKPHTAALACRISERRCWKRGLSSPSDLLKIWKLEA